MNTRLIKSCFMLVCCLFIFTATAQDAYLKIDSLKHILVGQKADTNKVKTLNELSSWSAYSGDTTLAFEYGQKALSLSDKLSFQQGKAKAQYNLGVVYFIRLDYKEALRAATSSLSIFKRHNDKRNQARSYSLIADIYDAQDYLGNALENYYSALKLYEEINDEKNIAHLKLNVARTYFNQDNYAEALEHYLDCLEYSKKIGQANFEGICYMGIGITYNYLGKYNEALQYGSKALLIFEKFNDDYWKGTYYMETGKVFKNQGTAARQNDEGIVSDQLFKRALKNYFIALEIIEKDNDGNRLANIYINLGKLYIDMNELSNARKYLNQCLEVCKRIGNRFETRDSYESLAKIDSLEGNFKDAYTNYRLFIRYKDSIGNQESAQKSVQANMQYEFDKKETQAKIEQERKDEAAKRTRNRQLFISTTLGIVALAILIIAFILFRNNKQKQRANSVLESTLSNLKATQSQLIQSEKMASLGELTGRYCP